MASCEVCGIRERLTDGNLVSVCDCYKKLEDAGRMHRECLQQYLEELTSRDEDATQTKCPRCHVPYRIRVQHRFKCDFAHCTRAKSLNNLFELIVIGLTLFCCVSVFFLLDYDKLRKESGGLWTLGILSGLTLLMVVFTLYKVFTRWKKASSDMLVSEA